MSVSDTDVAHVCKWYRCSSCLSVTSISCLSASSAHVRVSICLPHISIITVACVWGVAHVWESATNVAHVWVPAQFMIGYQLTWFRCYQLCLRLSAINVAHVCECYRRSSCLSIAMSLVFACWFSSCWVPTHLILLLSTWLVFKCYQHSTCVSTTNLAGLVTLLQSECC